MNDRDYIVIRGQPVRHTTAARDWVCGICEGGLVTKPYPNDERRRIEWRTVCSNDEAHDSEYFIHYSTLSQRESQRAVYRAEYSLVKEARMGFVKDRHNEEGDILADPQVRRAGRIALGQKRQGGGAEALPYFRIVPYDEGAAGEAILSQVQAALDLYAPGQESIKVLPVFLPAEDLFLIARSQYKLAGNEGRARCVGDGDTIQFKMGARNLLEIGGGQVNIELLELDGHTFKEGVSVPCPGGSHEGRWQHCEKCRLQFQVDFQIAGLPYIWQLSTGDQAFYTQFFTVYRIMRGHVEQGNARYLTEIPLLLRREEGTKARPQQTEKGIELRYQDMPLLSIEIHPMWLGRVMGSRVMQLDWEAPAQLESKAAQIPATVEEPAIVEPATWHEKVKAMCPARPWGANDVGLFITNAMTEYDGDDGEIKEKERAAVYKYLNGVIEDVGGDEEAVPLILKYLIGVDELTTTKQAAVIFRWMREDIVVKGKAGTAYSPHFKAELQSVFDAALSVNEDWVDPEEFGGDDAF